MKEKRVSIVFKMLMTCMIVAMACMLYVGDTAYAKTKKKDESCYINYVMMSTGDLNYNLKGSLKPAAVPADITWSQFFKGMKLDYYGIVSTSFCSKIHDKVAVHIYSEGEWKEILVYENKDGKYEITEKVDDVQLTNEYYDVKIGFVGDRGLTASTCIYARFAREYKISYELEGGSFTGKKLETYTTGADYVVPAPSKKGCEFLGWTGTGLNGITKNLVIKNGTVGDVSYTANWSRISEDDSKVEPTTKPDAGKDNPTTKPDTGKDNPTTKVTKPGKVKVSSASKKLSAKKVKLSLNKISGAAGYKVQFSVTKKFKKVLYEKTVNKASVNISSSKLKNKKKLYVRAKAYKVSGTTKLWSDKWSDAKKVTVKK